MDQEFVAGDHGTLSGIRNVGLKISANIRNVYAAFLRAENERNRVLGACLDAAHRTCTRELRP